ncbi:B3/4 domain-containing protein [Actinomyces qiguomingii]|uniref:B3/B4 domain-containing protein n=1 Tax=Actinomyces qiguomingii TaxID=2057800 RepID=UPI000CA02EC9|nr:phenylalanine--tRNA ligase beta subunit-related protein [Actinomyces qiguomingii]
MPQTQNLSASSFLNACTVSPDVRELRPDYRSLLIVVEGLELHELPAQSAVVADDLITRAEERSQALLAESPVTELPHVAAWREAYRAFGAKPQRTRNSLEALLRRAGGGLPRVNALTDIYNAISVLHQLPLGGEDFSRYRGPARLIRASGEEPYDTVAHGEPVIEHPEPGEVVWRDEDGVTCRRWNWRQCRRTALTDDTTTAFFILDALDPVTDDELSAAGDALTRALTTLGTDVRSTRRMISGG